MNGCLWRGVWNVTSVPMFGVNISDSTVRSLPLWNVLVSFISKYFLSVSSRYLSPLIYVYRRISKCSGTLLPELNCHYSWLLCSTPRVASNFPCVHQSHWVYSALGHPALSVFECLLVSPSCTLVMEPLWPAHLHRLVPIPEMPACFQPHTTWIFTWGPSNMMPVKCSRTSVGCTGQLQWNLAAPFFYFP